MNNLTVVKPEETEFIRCSACNKPLLRIFEKTKGQQELYKLIVSCCYCSDQSFARGVFGEFSMLPADGVCLGNVDINDNLKMTKLTTHKRRS